MTDSVDGSSGSEQPVFHDKVDAIEAINHDALEADEAIADSGMAVYWLFFASFLAVAYQYCKMKSSHRTAPTSATTVTSEDRQAAPEVELRELDPYADY